MAAYAASSFGALAYRQAGVSGAPTPRALAAHAVASEYGGLGVIADTIAVEDPLGTPERPISRRVTLLDRRGMTPIRSVWAAADGSYSFAGLRTDIPYAVLADDYTGTFNAVVADWVTAEVP